MEDLEIRVSMVGLGCHYIRWLWFLQTSFLGGGGGGGSGRRSNYGRFYLVDSLFFLRTGRRMQVAECHCSPNWKH